MTDLEKRARKAIDEQLQKTPNKCLTDALPHLELWVVRWFFDNYDVDNNSVGKMFCEASRSKNYDFIEWLRTLYDIEDVWEEPENLETSCYGSMKTGWGTHSVYITKVPAINHKDTK